MRLIWTFLTLSSYFGLIPSGRAEIGVTYFDVKQVPDRPEGYRIALIRDLPPSAWIDPHGSPEEAHRLASAARDWAYERFKKEYPGYTEQDFERMKLEDELTNRRATQVVVMKGGGSDEILGTLKLHYDDGGLPLERVLGWKYPRPAMKYGRYPKLEPDYVRGGTLFGNDRLPGRHGLDYVLEDRRFSGSVAQVLEFVVKPGEDLAPFLHFFAEADFGTRNENFFPKVKLSDAEKSRVPLARQREPMHLLPGEYVLYCDQTLIPYYEKLGFTLANEGLPVRDRLHVMKMSRDQFVDIGISRLKDRKGFARLSKSSWIDGKGLAWSSYAERAGKIDLMRVSPNDLQNTIRSLYFARNERAVQAYLLGIIRNEGDLAVSEAALAVLSSIRGPHPETVEELKKLVTSSWSARQARLARTLLDVTEGAKESRQYLFGLIRSNKASIDALTYVSVLGEFRLPPAELEQWSELLLQSSGEKYRALRHEMLKVLSSYSTQSPVVQAAFKQLLEKPLQGMSEYESAIVSKQAKVEKCRESQIRSALLGLLGA